MIGLEICEEAWRLDIPTRNYILECDIIMNSNASHFGTNKITSRINCIKSRMAGSPGAYIYTNNLGCDGGRLYFDGNNICMVNGEITNMGQSCPMEDVVIDEVTVDISEVRHMRLNDVNFLREASLMEQEVPIVDIDFIISDNVYLPIKPSIPGLLPPPEE